MSPNSAPATPRKPPSRLWLAIPWGLAILAAIGWTIAWFWTAHEIAGRLDRTAAALRAAGWQASWRDRRVYGYPFRLDVDVAGLKLADPSGWAIAAPTVKSEAYLFAATRWIIAIPDGLTFTRPDGDPVDVRARRLRFSLNSWDEHPPRLSLESEDLTFTTPGLLTKPFALARAANLQFYTRAGPDDQGALLLTVKDGVAAPGSWLEKLAPGKPAAITLDATFTHASQMQGAGIRDAALRWAHAGGAFDIQRIILPGVDLRSGRVSVDDDGRLTGDLGDLLGSDGRGPPVF